MSSFFGAVSRTWIDGIGAIASNGWTAAFVFIVLIVSQKINPSSSVMSIAGQHSVGQVGSFDVGYHQIVSNILTTMIMAAWSGHVIRYSIFREPMPFLTRLFDRTFFRYMGVLIFSGISMVLVTGVLVAVCYGAGKILFHESRVAMLYMLLVGLCAILVVWYMFSRLILMFVQAAIGEPFNWRAAWRGSRGQIFSYSCIYTVASLPLLPIVILNNSLISSIDQARLHYLDAFLMSLLGFWLPTVFATSAACLYSRVHSN
ncbi:hypothetical protein [Burkholderia territorii]|uniref:hypothetical protein n=1 Tax=Burkholderia territorii TaxID=1503055 RepID=UPI0012D87C0D|nr:hypothetical protein [Burkholderia territorii]